MSWTLRDRTYDTQLELALRALSTLLDLVAPKDYRTAPRVRRTCKRWLKHQHFSHTAHHRYVNHK